ncbi:MAG: malto-oligosyltrehalose synthase [Acidobacteriia bacterium]|nr:malto-oligosyltrehalose synthase [Terriglobia bacterium]
MKKRTRGDPVYVPASTYRLQFNRFFTIKHAAALTDYLDKLGISDCYASPLLMARPGSLHGYDVTDFTRINPEIGTLEEFSSFVGRLRQLDMGLLLDVVPNHMCIGDSSNIWWWDVLENGPSSPYAWFFDIDWNPPKEDLANKVLLPVLGDQYGRVLEDQQITIAWDTNGFSTCFYQTRLPVAPHTWHLILEPALAELKQTVGDSPQDVLELESILTAISHLPDHSETDEARIHERQREKEVIKRRLSTLLEASAPVRCAFEASLTRINGTPGDPRSFDRLERLLAGQAYRLSFWRVAADEINYRRFFDINDLAAIRVEDPAVFAAVHASIFDLIRLGHVIGLRIDHPDGLFEPERYFRDLQEGCRTARESSGSASEHPSFVVAEKILVGDEALRPGWEIEGTTGYDFLNLLNGVFVDRARRRTFVHLYQKFTGWSGPYESMVFEHSKKLIMQVSMSSELNVLARMLDRVSEQHRWSRDFTLENLRDALRDVVSCFPIYRTYIESDATRVDSEDERYIRLAISVAKRRNPALSASVFDFIQSVLLLEDPGGLSDEQRAERRLFVLRLQQYTGPVMAKGLEDTAFYRYYPLASLNEVGGSPQRFGVSRDYFHARNAARMDQWPNSLLTTSTHDSKCSEDVRARINVLSEIPAEWYRALRSWQKLNRSRKADLAGVETPSANAEYLLYQTLLGVWPLKPMNPQEHEEFVSRIQAYMEKALREAKLFTSWVSPNTSYETIVRNFIQAVLDPAPGNEFLNGFIPFQRRIAWAGMLNSLAQVLLKIAAPGVPDFYQGNEVWNFSLVDPDNRRPVDYQLRRSLLERLDDESREDPADAVLRLANEPSDGGIKLYVTSRALKFRKANRDLFARGAYLPLRAAGSRQKHIIAFARTLGRRSVLALAGRFFTALGNGGPFPVGEEAWGDTIVLLRKRVVGNTLLDVFTQRRISVDSNKGRLALPLAQVFSHLPFALLDMEDTSRNA